MFSNKSRDKIREIVNGIEKEREGKLSNLTEKEVQTLIESHTLLGCRFGIFLMFQVINQKSLKSIIRDLGAEKIGVDVDDLEDDDQIMRMLADSENIELIGESIQEFLMESFINDENASHAQAILIGHANRDIGELVVASHGFSDNIDKYYEEHHKDAPDTLSTSIN